MLALTPATRILIALAPVDLRRSFNGLYACVQERLGQDPLSGHVFVFTNRRRNRLKLLYWDGSGLWVCAKRLERGRFGWPPGPGASAALRAEELAALVSGLEVRARKDWFRA
jgi:transposase